MINYNKSQLILNMLIIISFLYALSKVFFFVVLFYASYISYKHGKKKFKESSIGTSTLKKAL